MKKNIIMESAIGLHNWRVKFNGEDVGLGYDQYKPNELYKYPEAYAIWGDGYVSMYKTTKDEKFLEIAKKCAIWLKNNKSSAYRNYSWGLPWEWEYWGAPKETSYVSTTSFAGDFFISLYKEERRDEYLAVIKSILRWLEDENGGIINEDGRMFYYSPFPKLRFSIFNATAKVGGLFAKTYALTKEKHYEDVALDCAKYIISQQNSNGSWSYSERNKNIDNYHTAFILESLSEIYETFPISINIKDSLDKGLRYYLKNFFHPNGRGEELSISTHKSKSAIPPPIKQRGDILTARTDETTLYSYGSGIRALSKASRLLRTKDYSKKVAMYAIKNLRRDDGAFNHQSRALSTYIREEGHMFDGLCTFLNSS